MASRRKQVIPAERADEREEFEPPPQYRDGKRALKLVPAVKQAFVDHLKKGVSISYAAKVTGVSFQAVYKEREKDEVFADEWDRAIEEGNDFLEDNVLQLGVTQKNLTALIFLLNGRRPEKFRQRHDMTSGGKSLSGFFGEAMALLEKGEAATFKAGKRDKT